MRRGPDRYVGHGRISASRGGGVYDRRDLRVVRIQRHQIHSETRKGGLFAEYIDKFLKAIDDASGYWDSLRSPADEKRYIESFWKNEGIRLQRESNKIDAVKRGLSKLCVNSNWGKLTERIDRSNTKIITQPQEMYRFRHPICVNVQSSICHR